MDRLVLKSYAKLNLYLEVLKKRKDAYHNIKTLFERIDLSDTIIIKSRQDKKIKVICNSAEVPKDNTNLAYRSARLLQESFHVDKGVEIKIIKRIPVASGLGGGSSNAATVLIGLNRLWRLNLTQDRLVAYARTLGSDAPFFIYNSSFAQGLGRGERIKPLKILNKVRLWHILVVPKIKVLTSLIYKRWDLCSGLTEPKYNAKILTLGLKKKDLGLVGGALFNSLEGITAKLYPAIRHIRKSLMRLGPRAILMSGSGPAVFGIVSSRKEAQALSRQLKGKNRPWQVFLTRTI